MKKFALLLFVGTLFLLVNSGLCFAKNNYHEIDAAGVKELMEKEEALVVFPLSPMEFDHKYIKGSINITSSYDEI